MFALVVEYITVNILLKIIKRKQYLFIQSIDNISALFCLPVIAVNTGFAYRCIAIRTNGFSLEATFIHIHYGITLLCKAIKLMPPAVKSAETNLGDFSYVA